MNLSSNRNLWLGALAIFCLFLFGIHHLATPLTPREVRWLFEGGSPLAVAAESWVGWTRGDGWMRLVLVGSAAPLLIAWVAGPSAGALAGVAAGVLVAALPVIAFGSRSIAPDVWGAAFAALAIALAASPNARARYGAGVVAAVAFLLQPSLAAVPAGAFVGGVVPLWKRGRIAGAAAATAAGILLVLLVLVPKLPWSAWDITRTAEYAAEAAIAIAALTVVVRVLTPTEEAPGTPFLGAALGASLAGLALFYVSGPSRPGLTTLVVSIAALATAPRSRSRAPEWLIAAAAGCALFAWTTAGPWTPGGPPLRETALDLVATTPPATQVMLSGGISRGAFDHSAGATGLEVVELPTAPVVATLRLTAQRPSPKTRRKVVEKLGDRILAAYGRRGTARSSDLAWSVYRPIEISMAPGGPRPNIAIISVDTLRADHLSTYGYTRETSPRLREWSRRARVYERAIATAPATAPSFASLLTGRLPSRHGLRSNYYQLDPGNWTLARILKRAGYDTAAFVSSFVLTRLQSGFEPGFDVYDETLDDVEARRQKRPIRLAPSLTKSVGAWLDQRAERTTPWFLWVHAIDPHGPYGALPPFDSTFDTPEVRTIPRDAIPDYQRTGSLDFYDYRDSYDEEILQTDHFLGKLIEKIEALESPSGTIVIFVADHGEQMGEHGFFFEHDKSLHREELHVPLVIKGLAIGAPGRRKEIVSLVDVVPTLLATLGIDTNIPLDGVPLAARANQPIAVYSEMRPGYVSIYREPWKLIVDRRGPEQSERLYDLRTDWAEKKPVDGVAGVAEERRPLLESALQFLDSDPLRSAAPAKADRRESDTLREADLERLRALGYTGD